MIFSLQQYNSLQLYQKAALLGKRSVFLMTLVEKNTICSLYYFYGFYVEALFNDDSGSLIDIYAFPYGKKLDRYLDDIVLKGF